MPLLFRAGSRNIALLLAALVLLAGAAARGAQPETSGPASAASLTAGVQETVLPNGLKVVTKEVHSAPVVSFHVWYKVGSRNEHTGITGVSHLLEHMLFKGTKRYGLGEISRTLFVNGAEFNAATWYDWTYYYQTLASDRLELAMQIEADRMVNSRIDASDLASEMSVVRSELEGRENNPGELLSHAVMATAFQAHPYQWPVIGWRTDVENVSRDAIYDYYRRFYGPNNAIIVIVGDFETERALEMVRRHFGKLKPIPEPKKIYTAEPPQRGERRVTVRRAGSLPMVNIGYKAPTPENPDHYALDMLDMILGTGRASRLYQALVQKGLATGAGASNPTMRDPFLFSVSATARPGVTAEQLEAALLAEIERVTKEPVTEAEMRRAHNQVEAQFIFGNNSVSELASQLGYWATIQDWRYLETYLQRVRAVTADEIRRVAQKYFVPEARTVGHFIPTEGAAPAGPPPAEASARVEKGKRDARPVPLPKPTRQSAVRREVTRFKLENGISVVVQENHANPTLALVGSVNAGRGLEPADKPGVAGLTAGLLTRGTESRSALEFATELESVGASLTANAGAQVVSINGAALSKDFDRLMDLLADMLQRPAFRQEELDRAKGQLVAGLEQSKDDPDAVASRAFNRAIYPEGHPLRLRPLEEAQRIVAGLTREDVTRFYRQQYGPEGMILVLTGDVQADKVRQALQARLGAWARNPGAKPVTLADAPAPQKGGRLLIPIADKSETSIVWGHAGGIKRADPDYYATQVLNLVLGGGGALNSRLGDVIRDEQGLAYSVFSMFSADRYAGPFMVFLGTNPANWERAVTSLEAEIRRIREQGITQRELDEAVAYLTGSFPVTLETNEGVANLLWQIEFQGLGADYMDRFAEYYRSVTVQQVNESARKHLQPDLATLVVAGPVGKP